eukprot:COSAG01_NODE_39849_length_471_cov_0.975806_2_plen_72_part_00
MPQLTNNPGTRPTAGKKGGFPGIGWFGANVSGFENPAQLAMLGDYSMAIFGWQAFLDGYNYQAEVETPRCH